MWTGRRIVEAEEAESKTRRDERVRKKRDERKEGRRDAIEGREGQRQEKERGERKVSPHLTGKVWKGCEDLQSLELDNRKAISKVVSGLLLLVKDAASEMEELKK